MRREELSRHAPEKHLISIVLVLFLILLLSGACSKNDVPELVDLFPGYADSALVELQFSMDVQREVYKRTIYGEAPQLAIWLENPDRSMIRTVWVSQRAGRNDWKGKFHCPVALPYWESRHRFEKGRFKERNLLTRLIDAISGATPTGGLFTANTRVPEGTQWDYYIEVNVSGDYNAAFPYWSEWGTPDPEGNGQPSLIYKGSIAARPGSSDVPALIGRTDQFSPVDSFMTDLDGITTAKEILRDIQVKALSTYDR